MASPSNEVENRCHCKCKLNLGIYQLSSQDEIKDPEQLKKRKELINQKVLFLDSSNSGKRCEVLDKISELKRKIGDYYFDNEHKVIAIPNQMPLPKKPQVFHSKDLDDPDKGKYKKYMKYMEEFYEDKLHIEIVNAVRNMNIQAFVFKGFQSSYCLHWIMEKGKKERENMKKINKAENDYFYPELNRHEHDVLEILGLKDLENEENKEKLECFKAWHRKIWHGDKKLEDIRKTDEWKKDKTSAWLIPQMRKHMRNEKKLIFLSNDQQLTCLYRYYWYYLNVQHLTAREWDSLIVLPESKVIINLEVKSGPKPSRLKEASDQTNDHLCLLKKLFGAVLSEGWKIVKAVCTPNIHIDDVTASSCSYCQQFIINDVNMNDMQSWIKVFDDPGAATTFGRFAKSIPCCLKNTKYENDEYENVLVSLVGLASLRCPDKKKTLIVDPYVLSMQTEKMITGNNFGIHSENEGTRDTLETALQNEAESSQPFEHLCFMLTPEQINAVKNTSKFLIIEGDFGTGKTYVLKEKAKETARNNPKSKIAYINLTSILYADFRGHLHNGSMSLMDMIATNDFEAFNKDNATNVKVVTVSDLCESICRYQDEIAAQDPSREQTLELTVVLSNYLQQHKFDHVFIDELPVLPEYVIPKANYFFGVEETTFCISLKSQEFASFCVENYDPIERTNDFKIAMKEKYDAVTITLKYNMRNSENVVNLAASLQRLQLNSFKNNINLTSLLPQKNIHGPVCYIAEKNSKSCNKDFARAVVNKYFQDCINQNEEAVVFLTVRESGKAIFNHLFENYSRDRKVVYLPDEFIPEYTKEDTIKHLDEVKEFLKEPKGILVTTARAFSGAQARNLVIFPSTATDLRNVILRCMSFAIVISTDANLTRGVNDHDLLEYAKSEKCSQENCKRIIATKNLPEHQRKWHTS